MKKTRKLNKAKVIDLSEFFSSNILISIVSKKDDVGARLDSIYINIKLNHITRSMTWLKEKIEKTENTA